MDMKNVDMVTQLINTGVRTKVDSKQGGSSSDDSDFEKMLAQAGQQQNVTAEDSSTSEGGTSAAVNAAASDAEEPGMDQMSIAAALVVSQPVIPVDPIVQVEVEEIAPAAVEAVAPEENAFVQQAAAAPVMTQETAAEQDTSAVVNLEPEEVDAETAVPLERPVEASEEHAEPETMTEDRPEAAAEHTVTRGKETAVKTEGGSEQPVVEDASAAAEAPVFEHTETVPVKVAETGEAIEPEAENAAEKIAQRIDQALMQNESTVELSLSPANLGQLTIQITRSGDGNLSIVLTAVTERAANLIDRHATNLQHILANNAQNVSVEVETRPQETQAQQFLNPDSEHNHQRQQQQRQKKDDRRSDGDFLQQLRLGLVGLD